MNSNPKPATAASVARRLPRLVVDGIPRWIRCYDNGGIDRGGSGDRYTVVFTGAACHRACGDYPYRAMSVDPCHPQGIGLWCGHPHQAVDTLGRGGRGRAWPPALGRRNHLGRRIRFQDLPRACQDLVMDDYLDVWNLRPGRYYGSRVD